VLFSSSRALEIARCSSSKRFNSLISASASADLSAAVLGGSGGLSEGGRLLEGVVVAVFFFDLRMAGEEGEMTGIKGAIDDA